MCHGLTLQKIIWSGEIQKSFVEKSKICSHNKCSVIRTMGIKIQ